jgi:hypothetical protein
VPEKKTDDAERMFICIRPDGVIEDLYSEGTGLDSLGPKRICRASNVEHDDVRQVWYVEVVASGERIFEAPSRERCIEFEKEYFRQAYLEGLTPFKPTG